MLPLLPYGRVSLPILLELVPLLVPLFHEPLLPEVDELPVPFIPFVPEPVPYVPLVDPLVPEDPLVDPLLPEDPL